MKNQALIITLAVLLALSLAAVGVLFVTGSTSDSTTVTNPQIVPTSTPDTEEGQPEVPDNGEVPGSTGVDETVDPPCAGPFIDGQCTPAICEVGFAWSSDAQDCEFVRCPEGLFLVDGNCEPPVVGPVPCQGGLYRNDAGDCVPFVLVDPVFCGPGLRLQNGECVTVCPDGLGWVGGFCIDLPDFRFDPDLLPEFGDELLSPDFDVNFDPALIEELDLSALDR